MKLALRRIPFVLMVAIGGSYVLLGPSCRFFPSFTWTLRSMTTRSYSYILPTGPHFGPHLPLHS